MFQIMFFRNESVSVYKRTISLASTRVKLDIGVSPITNTTTTSTTIPPPLIRVNEVLGPQGFHLVVEFSEVGLASPSNPLVPWQGRRQTRRLQQQQALYENMA